MRSSPNSFLVIGGALSTLAALLHLGCIAFGPSWYRFFGAGEQMARLAASGSNYPALVTTVIALVLLTWALLAFSGAGLVRKLPLLRTGLVLVTAIYLIRGAAVLPLMTHVPGRSETFWWWSSAICFTIGLIHFIGLRQVWARLSQAAA
ncbi:MAG: hypothetical protein H7Y19_04325 [Luteimonas sp.]|nr:hypothetical protein [Luteimonas sp.]